MPINKQSGDNELKPGHILRGSYEIIEQVGKGGMGRVYRCFDTRLKREVAIKEFSPSQDIEIDSEMLHDLEIAFQREATLLANLDHESLPIVYESFIESDRLYLVMEFVKGNNLKNEVKELREKHDGQFSVSKIRQWAKDLLEVLIYLHERESPIYHRDIKPENLKIRKGKVCLLDFGLAKGSAGSMSGTSAETTYGFTARFAPPEQMRGEKTTPQTDLYALAATLYYLLTGQEPINAHTRETLLKNGQSDPMQNIKTLRPDLDDGLAAVINQGLSITATGRPSSAREMLDRLEAKQTKSERMEVGIAGTVQPEVKYPMNRVPISIEIAGKSPPPISSPPDYANVPVNPPVGRKIDSKAHIYGGQVPLPKNLIVAAIALIALIGLLIFVAFRLWGAEEPVTASKPSAAADIRRLLVSCKLYNKPSLSADSRETLPRNTRVKVELERDLPSDMGVLNWFQIQTLDGSKEGWIYCKKTDSCLLSD